MKNFNAILMSALLLGMLSISAFSYDGLNDNEDLLIKYDGYARLNVQETDETKGKMGPILTGVAGAAGGIGVSIGSDIRADRPINWNEAFIAGGTGFVTGATGVYFGPVAGAAFGVSSYGALGAAFGNNGCGGCHGYR